MLQGTGSSVGKSILTAALCRIFKQDGYKVVPFKSQNMSSKSWTLPYGREISIAQAIQAEAAEMTPLVEMNPILLKPMSDIGSQVIINGELFKHMTASEYHEKKPKLKSIIKQAYDRLSSTFDIVVIEGAGSPAEINLRENDIVNMGLAELVDAPVVLVGDIDKGGVFASIYGTIMLMSQSERERVKGFIINKFRGDVELLKPGIKMIEELVEKPCLGVIPYIDINLEEEDSLIDKGKENLLKDHGMLQSLKEKCSNLEKDVEEEYKNLRSKEFDKIALAVRANTDINKIKEIMGL
ncbi:MAG: cobyric acid synthase [Gottschalkiaceae bacterium]|nr:MAG: cobyric acid synthase [Gottschalkiaceae bacterium]